MIELYSAEDAVVCNQISLIGFRITVSDALLKHTLRVHSHLCVNDAFKKAFFLIHFIAVKFLHYSKSVIKKIIITAS